MAELSEYTTASMIAKQHGVGYHTVLARIHKAKIETYKFGNQLAIKTADAKKVSYPPHRKDSQQ